MLQAIVDAFLTGVVFNRTAEDSGMGMLDIEGIAHYWISYLTVTASEGR